MTGRFLHRYNPTLEDEYRKTVEVDGAHYQLRIFDTAGQVRIAQILHKISISA